MENKNKLIISGLILLSFILLYWSVKVSISSNQQSSASKVITSHVPTTPSQTVIPKTLPIITATQDSIDFVVTPSLSPEGQVAFEISINTHSGSLDFDLIRVSTLKDDSGNLYTPLSWEGSPPGGHHRSGNLTFPPVGQSDTLTLIITGVGTKDRVFLWDIKL